MRNVLFVNIPTNLVPPIQGVVRTNVNHWQAYFPSNLNEALDWMGRIPVDVIVTDINYPDMVGINLLTRAQKIDPRSVKIALSDQKNIIDQLRAAGLAQQFLPRSFEMKSLQESIARAITLRDLLNQNMLQRIIPQVRSLPSLPNLYLQIADELNKPMPSPERVGQIISQDISMTAKVLQLVNSAHFGLPYQVANPTQATVLLGLEAIRDLVLVIKVFSNFDQLKLRHLGLTQLWNHSIAVGAYARQIARSLLKDKRAVEYSFVSGLLHDIGKLVLADNLPMKYHSAMEMAARQHLQLCDAEQETFGTTHAQVGAYLMWLWNLPDPVVVASAYHHAPSTHPEKTLTPMIAVHLANVFVHDASGGGNKRWLDPSLDRKCLAELSLLEQVEELQQSLVH